MEQIAGTRRVDGGDGVAGDAQHLPARAEQGAAGTERNPDKRAAVAGEARKRRLR